MAKIHRYLRRAAELAALQAAELGASQPPVRVVMPSALSGSPGQPAHFAAKIAEIATMTNVATLAIRRDHYAENYGPDNAVTEAAIDRIEFLLRPSDREARFGFLHDWARGLMAQGALKTYDEVIDGLHAHGFNSSAGTPYVKGARGIARCISAAYAYVRDELSLGDAGAACIAVSFVKPDGSYAYE